MTKVGFYWYDLARRTFRDRQTAEMAMQGGMLLKMFNISTQTSLERALRDGGLIKIGKILHDDPVIVDVPSDKFAQYDKFSNGDRAYIERRSRVLVKKHDPN